MREVYVNNPARRIDAEFFNKTSIAIDEMLRNMPHFFLNGENVVSGPFGSTLKSSAYLENGEIPFIRTQNIATGYINYSDAVFISSEDNCLIKNSELIKNDIVLSKVGNIGFFAKVSDEFPCCNISENIIGIKTRIYNAVTSHYIVTYLNCKFANNLVLRRQSGNVQPKLNVDDVTYIPIPIFSDSFYSQISNIVLRSDSMRKQSISTYVNAEKILIASLGLENFMPTKTNTSVKTFSSSFGTTGRLDAEYYQPKYDELFVVLNKTAECHQAEKIVKLADVVSIRKSVEPGSDAYTESGIPFLRVADITKFDVQKPKIFLDRQVFDRDELKPKKDTILFSKDGSVGIAYKVMNDMDAVTSGALLHLKVINPEIDPDYLTLLLNSFIVKMQADRDVGGSIINHWRIDEIKEIKIPLLPKVTQEKIAAQVQTAFALREKSKQLLKAATRAVEIAIEEDEAAAVAWLEANAT